MTDTRYTYSALCSWHGPISEAKLNGLLPGCPHCGSPLFEYPTRDIWDSSVAALDKVHPGYSKWVEFCGTEAGHMPCKAMGYAAAAWDAAGGTHVAEAFK